MPIQKILVPYDFSPHSEHALDWAIELAERYQASLELLHVIHILPPVVDIAGDVYEQAEQAQLAAAQKHLETVLGTKAENSSVRFDSNVRRGVPFQAICDEAATHKADLIVMGSHGRTGLSHVFIGSVAERVIRHAPCPVLVTKLPAA